MSKRRGSHVVGVGLVLGLIAACSIGDVDVSNKACPCGPDYVCDAARNLCVTPQELAGIGTDGGGDAGEDGAPVCTTDVCPCTTDIECKDPERPRCSAEKLCVECVRTPDSCPAGSYCNAESQCTLGCKAESDCQISPVAPHCDTTRRQCVECTTTDQCADGKLCSPSGQCVEGCDLALGKTCPTGKECCADLLLDTKADPLNCGACGTTCSTTNGTPRCSAGVCAWTCASGFGHCIAGNTGCETNLRTDVTRCGSCTRNCNVTTANANGVSCAVGACTFTTCKVGFGNCDGIRSNGCDCACGVQAGQICCPGSICTGPGLRCVGADKCQ